ncbi:hypothetical protein Tco_0906579 [Tanacetum coccineum]|uniref:Uncharacterized protein n=1 Tax=Tanacetum coccineum TaxID=301880 RepID=A0ABQ5CN21_9ASTR
MQKKSFKTFFALLKGVLDVSCTPKWLKKNAELCMVEKFLVEKNLVYKDEDSWKAEMAKEKGQAMAKADFYGKPKRRLINCLYLMFSPRIVSIKSPKNQLNKYESSSIRESSSFPRGKTVMELINDGFPVDSFVHVSTNWKTKVDAWKG